ncbi:MAG: hypothetical protein ACOX6J_02150 [Oscillospiraceae bacterium]|jgi:hypothetical protein
MKVLHCEDNRAKKQKVVLETEDSRFCYELDMDYAKGLPQKYKHIPYAGNIAGGAVDAEDNLYLGLRGGSYMSTKPASCLVKLDKEGNYLESIGEGIIGGLHFFECTDHDSVVIVDAASNYAYEMSMDGKSVIRTFGTKGRDNGNGMDIESAFLETRLHRGLFATEPFEGLNMENSLAWKMAYDASEMGGPFHNPTDVDMDSEGNYYFSDGYGNCAVQKFDREGNFVKTWGGKGVYDGETDTPGKMLIPHSICVDANDHIWVCDREKDAVHIFDTEGNVIGYLSHNLGQPSGVDCDSEHIYVVGRAGYLTIFDLELNVVGKLGFYNGNLRAHHIAADSAGNLYLFPTHANNEHQVIKLKRI